MPPLFSVTTLGRSRPPGVVLLHGLFANSGFWLPYLHAFDRYRITLVDIDYPALFASGAPLAAVCAELDARLEGAAQHLLAHSFGCCVAIELQGLYRTRSLICPTFVASAFARRRFAAHLGDPHATEAGLDALLDAALTYKTRCAQQARYHPGDTLYLAQDDPYFRYAAPAGPARVAHVRGGHFEIGEAVALAASGLDATDGSTA